MSLTQYNVIPIQWLQFAIICTFSLHHTITVKKKKPCPPIQEPRSAALEFTLSQSMKTWLPRSRSKPAYACHFTKVPTDQNTRNLIRERREHVFQVTAALGLSSTCATTCGEPQLDLELACSRWWRCFYLAAIGCTRSLGNSCFLWCIPSLAFDQNWLVDALWQRQYGRWLSW